MARFRDYLPAFVRGLLFSEGDGRTHENGSAPSGAEPPPTHGPQEVDGRSAGPTIGSPDTWEPGIEVRAAIADAAEEFSSQFGDHEGVSEATVGAWILQFEGDWEVAVKLLKNLRYYSASQIRALTKQLVEIAAEKLSSAGARRVAVVAIGDAGSGSSIVARALREHVKPLAGYEAVTLLDLAQNPIPGTYDAIVVFDDFSGTGDSITTWWRDIGESVLLPHAAHVMIGVLVMNHSAEEPISRFADSVVYVDLLVKEMNVFAESSQMLDQEEKAAVKRRCEATGCSARYLYGYGGCGLLLAFKHLCPNNSLPVFWYNRNGWRRLFKRSAI